MECSGRIVMWRQGPRPWVAAVASSKSPWRAICREQGLTRRRSSNRFFTVLRALSCGDQRAELPHFEAMTEVTGSATSGPSAAAAAAAAVSAAHAMAAESDDSGVLVSLYSSFEEMGVLSSSSMDSDAETCTLVADPTGDVQLLCDSDPTHPISLAEKAALRPIVPTTLLQDIEAKLEADLVTLVATILFAVGFISLEFGVDALIDTYFGDSPMSDIACATLGLMVVFGARLSNVPIMRLDKWR